jgi:hypothetical protein
MSSSFSSSTTLVATSTEISLVQQQQQQQQNSSVPHIRHHHLPLTARRILLHVVKVGLRMAAFRLIFGFIKQLFMKGAIFKGVRKISVGIETELVSYNPLKWAAFGMTLSMYRPVQLVLESILKKFTAKEGENNNKTKNSTSETTSEEDHHNTVLISKAKFFSVFLAGIIVSLPIGKIFNKNSRVELMLYVTVRAIHAIVTGLVYPSGMLPAFVYARSTEFWNCITLTAISSVLLGNSTFNPETHSKEYANFLVHATTMAKHQMQSVANLHSCTWSPGVADHCTRHGHVASSVLAKITTNPVNGVQTLAPSTEYCKIMHPRFSSCTVANLEYFLRHFLRVSLPLYGPLKVVTSLAKGPGPWIKNPVKTFSRLALSIFQSGMFLTTYVCLSYRFVCVFNQTDFKSKILTSLAVGSACGLALMFEPVERQTDLVLFCGMHGLRSGVLLAHKMNWIPRPKMSAVVVAHSAAWAALFLVYETRPNTLRGIFASMMKMFIGDRKETHVETVHPKIQQHQQQQQQQEETVMTVVTVVEEIVVVEEGKKE